MFRPLLASICIVVSALPGLAAARDGEKKFVRMQYVPREVKIKLNLVRVGQPDYGDMEVEIKLNHFLQGFKEHFDLTFEQFLELRHNDPLDPKIQEVIRSPKFEDFMSDKPIEVIRDPYGYLHAFDGHHLLVSLLKLEFDEFTGVLHEDFYVPPNRRSRVDMDARVKEFEEYMVAGEAEGLVRLKTRTGRKISLSDLPRNPLDMVDNPFRSLVWMLKKADVFVNRREAMQEFVWADLLYRKFRSRGWNLNFKTKHEFSIAIGRAIQVLSTLTNEEKATLTGFQDHIPSDDKPRRLREFRDTVVGDCEILMSEFHL